MATMPTHLTFYHSKFCPRCHLSGLWLKRALERHPYITVTKVELLTNMARARADGVTTIPTLVAQGERLKGVLLTPARIERFLESLAERP